MSKKYKVILPKMELTVEAEDENDAEYQAIGVFDWGNVDMEVEESEDESDVADTPYYSNENNFTFSMYEGLCELIRGDSPNWTHEEVVEKLELAMDCLIFVENEVDHKEFIDWNIQNKKENGYE